MALFVGSSCSDKHEFPYQGKDRIQFRCYTVPNSLRPQQREYFDSRTFSFGLLAEEIEQGEARLVVEYTGTPSDRDRTYYVSIVADKTTAQAGIHYMPFPREQIIGAGMLRDTLRITILREHMNRSFNNPVDARLQLRLEASDDFDLGIEAGVQMTLLMNDYLTEPLWWNSNTGLGYYHPLKWRILIGFNELYANNPDSTRPPFDINNNGRAYRDGLNNYLNAIPTFDEETGARLFLNTMQMPNN
ncbi:MAG: DUF4843 domain-containing protein [Rikenellaceae bacterium]|nr:DUF4843 domain-containing protein [Rikenellaceae bacterium]MCL2693299.1 DUF4843 domain-containing protein [Rikenellaceae bacterium]